MNYDSAECSKVNPVLIKNFTRSSLELQPGYWRYSLYSPIIENCYNDLSNCRGGWVVDHESCATGHLGALCEECDVYNVRGEG